ncbi:MAG: RagB/SusD family nutrient uptake outer membrane protein, partial [Tannerella sp.]|nr:RagB/SusD family nutrient uptake outer membrane protein [Tannerella sp.]
MKKNKFYLIAMICLLGCMVSCSDDFLDRIPENSINDGSFWKSASDVKLYANNFYTQAALMPTYPGPYAVQGTDDWIYLNYDRRLNGEATLPGTGGGWATSDWAALRNLNYFFEKADAVEVSFDEIKQYIGEAHYFRAWFYFEKLKTFGDVPYTSKLVGSDSEELYLARTPRNELTDNILQELDLAVEYLPARAGAAWNGRITKEAALQLQSRIALFEGTWEKYHGLKGTAFRVSGSDGTKYLQKAADAAGQLIALSEANGYPGLDNVGADWGYKKLFGQTDYTNSKEILVWRKYSRLDGVTNGHVWDFFKGGNSCSVTKSHVDAYLCTDGKPIAVSHLYKGDHTIKDAIIDRDPRLVQTIWVDDGLHYYTDHGGIVYWEYPNMYVDERYNMTGYLLFKHTVSDYVMALSQQSDIGLIIMRYAEALLNYAEAKAELGTITQDDIDKSVNLLRNRVGMPGLDIGNIAADPNWLFTGISPLLQEIRRER